MLQFGLLFSLTFGGSLIAVNSITSSSMISGHFNNCTETACRSFLEKQPCAMQGNNCKCAERDSSSCGTLSQQVFVNITGAENEKSLQWSCCYCAQNESYCCDMCSRATAPPPIVQPSRYLRAILIFLTECKQVKDNENDVKNSLVRAIVGWTNFPRQKVTVKAINCTTGQQPFCGVDVENFKAHHRAKRLVSGRTRGTGSKNKNKKGKSFSTNNVVDLKCEAVLADVSVTAKNLSLILKSLDLLRHLQENNSLIVSLQDEQLIYSSYLFSAVDGSLFSFNQAPTTKPPPPPPKEDSSPLTVNLMPLIYAGGSIIGLVTLCVVWKFIKHSWLLYRKKFTAINSDRVDHKKARRLQKIMEAMEENDTPTQAKTKPFPPASNTTQENNWTSAKSLVPAYEPTVLHNQRTPPKLILDDQDSDTEPRSDSMTNSADDENIGDILNTDEEQVLRRTSGSLSLLALGNPGYEDEDDTVSVKEVNKSGRSKMAGPKVANGDDHAQLNLSALNSVSQRKAPIASSNLSLNAPGEKTDFPPTKSNKKPSKQQDSDLQNKGKTLLSPKLKARNFRKASVTPLDDDNTKLKEVASKTRKNSALNSQDATNGERRKSSMSASDNDVLVITSKDKDTKREKDKVFTFEYKTSSNHEAGENSLGINERRKSKANEWDHTQTSFAKDEEQARKRLTAPVAQGNERRKSLFAERDEAQLPDMEGTQFTENLTVSVSKAKGRRTSTTADKGNIRINHSEKMSETLIAPKLERRTSLRAGEEIKTSDENGTKADTRFDVEDTAGTPLVSEEEEDQRTTKSRRKTKEEVSPIRDTENRMSKAKRKKKTNKKNKKKADNCDGLSDMEKAVLTDSEEFTRTVEIPARAEENPVASTDLEGKDSKKKKKNKKGKKTISQRKWQESEESGDDNEEKIEEINANTTEPEKRTRKKRQKNATTTRKLSVNSEETNRLSPGHA